MDLVTFLRARLDDDQAKAEEANDPENFRLYVRTLSDDVRHPIYIGAGRVLAEVEAKRRLVALWEEADRDARALTARDDRRDARIERAALASAVQALALPYAGHEDYDERWRP